MPVECASFDGELDSEPPSSGPDCSDCPCEVPDGSCVEYYAGTAVCPAGSKHCRKGSNRDSVLDACIVPSTGQQAILHTGHSDELDYYLLPLLLEMENSPTWTCAAS